MTDKTENKIEKRKAWFLTRNKEFVAAEITSQTKGKRFVKILEGKKKNKTIVVHPEGIAFGKLYPRLFFTENKPSDFFCFGGRVLLANNPTEEEKKLVPEVQSYRFQPVLSHVIDCVLHRENVLLTGGAGVGKTSHIIQLAARIGQPVIRVNLNGETRISDFLGKIQIADGKTFWTDGILPLAMRNGYWLIVDEIDSGEPNILSLLHPILEENGFLVLKENQGEVIKPHPKFRIFGTANSIGVMQDKAVSYAGTNQMNAAFLDRWHVMEMPPLDAKTEVKVILERIPGIKHKWVKRIVQFANMIRNQKNEMGQAISDTFSTRRCLQWSKKTALLRSPIKAAEVCFGSKLTAQEKEATDRLLVTVFGSKNKSKDNEDGTTVDKSEKTGKTGKKRGRKSSKVFSPDDIRRGKDEVD